MTFHRHLHTADLGPTGEIIFEGQFFKSPSAFSVFVKRKVRPRLSWLLLRAVCVEVGLKGNAPCR